MNAIFENIGPRIIEEVSKAQDSIYVAVAWFTNSNILDALVERAENGCTISLIISNDAINEDSAIDHDRLKIGKSKVYRVGDGDTDLMHNKFCIIDGKTVISGSYNWSYKAESNLENVVISEDTDLARQFISEFNRIRKEYFPEDSDTQDEPLPIDKIIKRLEILKNLVLLEEVDQLDMVSGKLVEYDSNSDINRIIKCLNDKKYSEAISGIEAFISKYQQLNIWTDPEIAALKLEIKNLETQVNAIDNERITLEKTIADFEHRHAVELGDIILELLKLRKQSFKNDSEKYAEAEKDEKEYKQQFDTERDKDIQNLNEDEKAELKRKFRKASALCHPDKYSNESPEVQKEAERIFKELNEANSKNDLNRVIDILQDLENGNLRASKREAASDKDILRKTIEQLKVRLSKLEATIVQIKNSETYQTINSIEDWDAYFEQTKINLEQEFEELKMEQS